MQCQTVIENAFWNGTLAGFVVTFTVMVVLWVAVVPALTGRWSWKKRMERRYWARVRERAEPYLMAGMDVENAMYRARAEADKEAREILAS